MKNGYYPEDIGGHILIIGGAEDKLNERHILRKFIELSGGANASVLIIPLPSDFPEVAGNVYKGIFEKFGVRKAEALYSVTRDDVLELDAKKILKDITGVFITGGDQMRLSSVLGGTNFLHLLKKKVDEGITIAGSSAGAAAMSTEMIVRGESTIQPKKDSIRISPGLGILKNIIIDQHFTQRTRLSRLITAVCYNPKNLGIGIDENTAIHLMKDGVLEVMGAGTVTVVDGSDITLNNIAEVKEEDPFSVVGLKMHILSSSIKYNVYKREPIQVAGKYFQL